MTVAAKKLNPAKYGALLATTLPLVIKTEAEYERMLALVEQLMDKGARATPEEARLFELIAKLVEDYEEERHPIPDAPPNQVLQHLMEEHRLRQSDLLHIFGSRGYTSDIVNGKRAISKAHAKSLGEFFNVSLEVFL